MTVKQPKFVAAFTLIEVMLAMAALTIVALGALSYQYHVAVHTRIARAQTTGMRTAQLLLEDWKSTGGSKEYDVYALGLGFSSGLKIPSEWSEGEGPGLGAPLRNSVHSITVDGLPMLITLRWDDVAEDAVTKVTLRQLSVIVRFGVVDENSHVMYPKGYMENMRPIIMTTYVRLDGST